jgi:hypothetical protein
VTTPPNRTVLATGIGPVVLAANLTSTAGFLDLAERRLITNPAQHLRSLATAPDVLGLSADD